MELTEQQQAAIQRIKPRLKANGWEFIRPTRTFDYKGGIAVEGEFMVTGHHHWLVFYPDGSIHPTPVTMCTRDGYGAL